MELIGPGDGPIGESGARSVRTRLCEHCSEARLTYRVDARPALATELLRNRAKKQFSLFRNCSEHLRHSPRKGHLWPLAVSQRGVFGAIINSTEEDGNRFAGILQGELDAAKKRTLTIVVSKSDLKRLDSGQGTQCF